MNSEGQASEEVTVVVLGLSGSQPGSETDQVPERNLPIRVGL